MQAATATVKLEEPAAPKSSPGKLPNFFIWADQTSRFLPRPRSQSTVRSAQRTPVQHPLQSTKLSQHSLSSPNLSAMAAATASPAAAPEVPSKIIPPEPDMLSSTADPRTPSSASTVSRNDSLLESAHHPDLNDEISKLNEKLVDALNHQSNLDESLQQSKHELDRAQQRIAELLAQAKEQTEKFKSEQELRAKEYEQRTAEQSEKWRAEKEKLEREHDEKLFQEQDMRIKAEKEKKAMEQELETLTASLFQEANTMVADARREKEASDKKIEQLKSQMRDSEVLLESHQEQLSDLKNVLEKMTLERAEIESATHASTNPPSSPAVAQSERMTKMFESAHYAGQDPSACEVSPDHPLHFSHLIQPVLRTDVSTFEEFALLIKQARAASPPPSRVVSGSFSSLNIGAGNSIGPAQNVSATPQIISAVPNANVPLRPIYSTPPPPTLRDSKVFKRALAEDIEPTLRLDIAPGVSWMVRRPILNAMIDGGLVVEPMPPSPVKFRGPINQCALCGENRIGDTYARKHRFRISEDRETRRFPLCDICLGRLRSCGDLLSFLRMVTNGHWRADSEEEVKTAWEEYVKLRERMFWHRMAGGVVPVTHGSKETVPNSSALTASGDARKESSDLEDPFAASRAQEKSVEGSPAGETNSATGSNEPEN